MSFSPGTTTVYFQDTAGQPLTDRFSESADYVAQNSSECAEYAEHVERGDYVAVVYRTPSNGGSLMRSMGHVETVERTEASVDVRFSDSRGDAYLHLNAETGDYYFQDGRRESPADGWRVEKIAYTPEKHL